MPLTRVTAPTLDRSVMPSNEGQMVEMVEAPDSVNFFEATRMDFERESWAAKLIGMPQKKTYESDPDYDVFDDIEVDGLADHMDFLMTAESKREYQDKRQEVYDRLKMDEMLSNQGLFTQLAAGSVNAVLDPFSYVSGGAALKVTKNLGRVTRMASVGAVAGGGGQALSESALQMTDPFRTADESLLNIAAATALGGGIGAAGGSLGGGLPKNFRTETYQPTQAFNSTVGAARVADRPPADGETLVSSFGAEKLFVDPVGRMATSDSAVTRRLNQELTEQAFLYNKSTEAGGDYTQYLPIEAEVKQLDALVIKAYDAINNSFKEHRQSKLVRPLVTVADTIRRGAPEGKLTYQDFKRRIYIAMENNDTDAVPEVQKAARLLRKEFVEPIYRAGVRAGIFTGKEDVKTAQSWILKVRDIDKIENNRQAYTEIHRNHLLSKRAEAEKKYEKLIAEIEAEDIGQGQRLQRAAKKVQTEITEMNVRLKDVYQKLDDLSVRQKEIIAKGDGQKFGKEFEQITAKKADLIKERSEFSKKRSAAVAKQEDILSRAGKVKELEEVSFYANRDDAEINQVADEIVNRITGTGVGRLPYDYKIKASEGKGARRNNQLRGSAKSRVYDIPNELERDFLLYDLDMMISSYRRSVGVDAIMMRRLGSVDGLAQLKEIEADYNRMMSDPNITEAQRKKLKEDMDRDLALYKGVLDRMRGVFAVPENYTSPLMRAERILLSVNYLRLLGGMAVSAIPDIAKNSFRNGFKRAYGTGFKTLFADKKVWREFARQAHATGIAESTLATRAKSFADLEGYMSTGNKIEAGLDNASAQFGNLTFMNYWNQGNKIWAQATTSQRIFDGIDDLLGGKIKPDEKKFLRQNYISDDMAQRIKQQYLKHGENYEGLKLSAIDKWDDADASLVFRSALRREADLIVTTPGQDKPLMFSRPGLRLFFQFKTFGVSSIGRTLVAGLQQRDMSALLGAANMIALGAAVYVIKTYQYGGEPDFSVDRLIIEGIDRSGLLGVLIDYNNIAEKVTRGRLGLSALVDSPIMSRYASRSAAESLFGPSYGTIMNLVELSGAVAAGDFSERDVRTLRRLLPYQNVFYLRSLFDKVEGGIVDASGLEAKKK